MPSIGISAIRSVSVAIPTSATASAFRRARLRPQRSTRGRKLGAGRSARLRRIMAMTTMTSRASSNVRLDFASQSCTACGLCEVSSIACLLGACLPMSGSENNRFYLLIANSIRLFCSTPFNRLFSCHMTQAGRSDNLLNGQPGWFAVWLGAVLAAAAVLRLFRLGAKSFWLDEATSVILTQVDNHTFVQALILRQGNMTFYYLLLRAWSVLGQTETTMRLLSVVFGVAAIPAIYLLGRDLFGQKAGRVAALLLSVHVFHIRYSQEARGYSLFVCLAIVSSLFCIRLSQRQSVTNCARYIV